MNNKNLNIVFQTWVRYMSGIYAIIYEVGSTFAMTYAQLIGLNDCYIYIIIFRQNISEQMFVFYNFTARIMFANLQSHADDFHHLLHSLRTSCTGLPPSGHKQHYNLSLRAPFTQQCSEISLCWPSRDWRQMVNIERWSTFRFNWKKWLTYFISATFSRRTKKFD